MKKSEIVNAIVESYLKPFNGNKSQALKAMAEDLGMARYFQSGGYLRYGTHDIGIEWEPIIDVAVPDPTNQTPDERPSGH